MRIYFVCLFLLITLAARPVSGAVCASWFQSLAGNTLSRAQQQRARKYLEQVVSVEEALATNAGSHLSATDYELRRASDLIDNYLLLGDIRPLLKLYSGPVRRVERAYLERQRNLANIANLESQLAGLTSENLESQRQSLAMVFKEMGALEVGQGPIFSSGDVTAFTELLTHQIQHFKIENLALEKAIGRDFDVYREVRRHLDAIITRNAEFVLGQIQKNDNRSQPTRLELMMEMMPAAAPSPMGRHDALAEQQETRKQKVQRTIEQFGTEIEKVDLWIVGFANKSLTVPQLRTALSEGSTNYLTLFSTLRESTLVDNPDEFQSRNVLVELTVLRKRLASAQSVIKLAQELDEALGVHSADFARDSTLLPEGEIFRPEIKDVEKVASESHSAEIARGWMDLRRQTWAFIDATILLGFASGAAPLVGGAADVISGFKNTKARDFVYGKLLRAIYEEHVAKQYFPKLILLKRSEGEDGKLALMLENLNAGTKDELLLTFARRTDMSALWLRIKAYAKSVKEIDHHHLYNRMIAAELRVFGEDGKLGLGTISVIDQSSTARYLIAGLLQAGLAAYFGQNRIAQFCANHGFPAPALPTSGKTTKADDEGKKLARLDNVVQPAEEGQILRDLNLVLRSSQEPRWSPEITTRVEAATERLAAYEDTLSRRVCAGM